jgi:PAS domain S-box-containing protein
MQLTTEESQYAAITVPDSLFRRSATELLRIAASVCDVRFGVVRLLGHESIVTDPAISFAEAALARQAEAQKGLLVVFEEKETQAIAPEFRFYAAVKLLDASGQLRGTFAVLHDHPRRLDELQKQRLIQIGGQLTRDLEMIDMIHMSRAEQTRLERVLDSAPVAVYGFTNGRLSYVNTKFAESLGYSREELLALNSVTEIVPEDQREMLRELIRRHEAGDDRDVRFVTQLLGRDGRLLDAEIHGSAVRVAGNRKVIGVAVDVTKTVEANRQLREREEYFRALTENLMDVIEIISDEHVLTYVSPSIERILGYKPEEQLGKAIVEKVHPEDRERLRAVLTNLARDARLKPAEYRFEHKNGTWRVLEMVATNLLNHPQIRGLVLNLRDVTDRKRMELELEQLQRLSSLGRLAAHVAHEFNNVLMGIQPMVDIVRRRAVDDSQLVRAADLMTASISRGKRITTDILRFGRPAQLAPRPVKVQELLHQAVDEIRPTIPERIEVNLDLPETAMHVYADAGQLSQVLINLALNARDAMQDTGGTLTIAARPGQNGEIPDADRFIHFTITDTGTGIPSEDLPFIFEPLFTTKKTGNGLGLSVVFQIVTAHRGHISVQSERGKGTTFHLFIPALAEPQHEASETLEQSRQARSLRVLVVEDEEAIATGLRWSLETRGVDVRVVTTGADVLPAVREFAPDLMIVDLSLGDEDGRSVYARVSAVSPLPVIFSSGNASTSEIENLLTNRRAAFLMKPYSTDELLQAIDRLLGSEEKAS